MSRGLLPGIRTRLTEIEECIARLTGANDVIARAYNAIREIREAVVTLEFDDGDITQEMCPHGMRMVAGGNGVRCACCGTGTFGKKCATCTQPSPREGR